MFTLAGFLHCSQETLTDEETGDKMETGEMGGARVELGQLTEMLCVTIP